jgi:hypothetical protein
MLLALLVLGDHLLDLVLLLLLVEYRRLLLLLLLLLLMLHHVGLDGYAAHAGLRLSVREVMTRLHS